MTAGTMWVRAGRNYGANAPMLHTDSECRMMDKSELEYREATENEKDTYEVCSVCTGDFEQSKPSKGHYNSLLAAAEEE